MNVRRKLILSALALSLSACAGMRPNSLEAPELSVVNVTPQNFSLRQQVLRFSLSAFNPNSVDLPIEEIDFVTRFAGVEVGQGTLAEPVTLAANGKTPIDIDVTADMSKVMKNFAALFSKGGMNLDYEVEGTMKPASKLGFGLIKLPFKTEGNLLDQSKKG